MVFYRPWNNDLLQLERGGEKGERKGGGKRTLSGSKIDVSQKSGKEVVNGAGGRDGVRKRGWGAHLKTSSS